MALLNGGLGGGDVIPPQPSGGGPSPATTVVGPDSYGDPAVVGVGTEYARDDHDHGLPAAPAPAVNAWIAMDLLNGWTAAGGSYAAPSYRLTPDGEHVEIAGVVHLGAAGTAICTLPSGYIPPTIKSVPAVDAATGAVFLVTVDASGDVTPQAANTYPQLDCIVFPIDI